MCSTRIDPAARAAYCLPMMTFRHYRFASLLVVATSACAQQPATPPRRDAGAPPFLYVWSQMPASDTSARRGFLADHPELGNRYADGGKDTL
jgi:hypothetical protein